MLANSRLLGIALLFALAAQELPAQQPKAEAAKKEKEVPFELQAFWLKDAGVGTRAWVACMGQSIPGGPAWNPCGLICARVGLAEPQAALPDWQFRFDECLPIWHRYLELIQDGRRLPSVERKELKELAPPDWGMYLAIVQAIDRSHLATPDMFNKSAAAYDGVGYPQLRNNPGQYRGKIITVKGQITRVLKNDAPRFVTSDAQYVYSTSIQGPFKNEPPFVVLFTDFPAGISYTDKLDLEVVFQGYFLGHVLFPGDPKRHEKDVTAPYFVGRTLTVTRIAPVTADTEPYSAKLIAWSFGLIVGSVGLAVLLQFWLRRGDRRIQSQLASVRDKHLPFNLEPAPEPPPLAEPVQPSDDVPPPR